MNISIDASALNRVRTGTNIYLTEILTVWRNEGVSDKHQFFVFTTKESADYLKALQLGASFNFITCPSSRPIRLIWQQLVLPFLLVKLKVNVHWGAGFVLPIIAPLPMVVTVHDMTFQLFPELHERLKRLYFPLMIRLAVLKARKVIAISEATRFDLGRLLPRSVGKTIVTPLAARVLKTRSSPRDRFDDGYVLFVGTLEPRKNLIRLADAWALVSENLKRKTKLIVVGATGWMIDQDRLSRSQIECKGAVSDTELAALLSGARFFIYPSLYEGFGLPVIEAMAHGVPVITSNRSAMSEVAGDAALLIDPESVVDIKNGIETLLSDEPLCEDLASRGLERASHYSWNKTAALTLNAIESAAK